MSCSYAADAKPQFGLAREIEQFGTGQSQYLVFSKWSA